MNPIVISRFWRPGFLLLTVVGSLVFLVTRQPFGQDPHYHGFADGRTMLGIPNFCDVASNVPFLLVGAAGLRLCRLGRIEGAVAAWGAFFAGVALVGVGSAWYHWRPNNETLVWDRLPMAIGFMALTVALVSEALNEGLSRLLLAPALVTGLASVVYWHLFDDLRFYAWVQVLPLLTVPVVLALFRRRYSHRSLLGLAVSCYVLAKVSEAYDPEIFGLTQGTVGGHALKHFLAAGGCLAVLEMLRRRSPLPPRLQAAGLGETLSAQSVPAPDSVHRHCWHTWAGELPCPYPDHQLQSHSAER
jgi:hypothetical protein